MISHLSKIHDFTVQTHKCLGKYKHAACKGEVRRTEPYLPNENCSTATSDSTDICQTQAFFGTNALIEIEDNFREKTSPFPFQHVFSIKYTNPCLQLAQNSLITHKMLYLHLGMNQRVENYLMLFFLLSHYKCQCTLHPQLRLTIKNQGNWPES